MKQNWKRNTAVFITSQMISLFGSSLVQYAITWYITLTYGSALYATISVLCGFLPTLLLAPFAGVWADRYSRKTLIILADGSIAFATLILALVFMTGYTEVWLLFAASVVRALGAAVQTPCISAILPDMVPEEKLTRVNGINASLQSLMGLLSPVLSGVLLSFARLEHIFFIDVITAAVAITIFILFLHVPKHAKADAGSTDDYLADLKDGLRYIGRRKYLKNFFLFCAVFYVFCAPLMFLTPLHVTELYGVGVSQLTGAEVWLTSLFGGEVWRLSALEIFFAVGMTLGGVAIAVWGGFKNRVKSIALAAMVMSLGTIVLGLPIHFWTYMAIMAVLGIVLPAFNTPAMVLLQERVPGDYLGRVFGVMTMLSSSMMPLGMLIFGPLAEMEGVSISWLLVGTGAVLLLMSFLVLANKPLMAAGVSKGKDKADAEPEAAG